MNDPRKLPALSQSQLEIMNLIWDHQPCSVTQMWNILHERRGVSRNTVHTLMTRLADKGWLICEESDDESHRGAFLYEAAVSQDAVQKQHVDELVENVFNGSAENLVLALLDGSGVSQAQSARIQKLIADARRKSS